MTRLGEALLELDDPPVKALVVYGANPMGSNPDQARVRRGLEREDLFTVVIEQFPTDTVDYADIVLPATMQTEHLDVNDGYGHMYVSLNRPAVAPPGECLLDYRDVPAAGAGDGARRAVALRRRRDAGRTLLGDADFERLWDEGWMRLEPRAVRAVHRRLPDALGQARVLVRAAVRTATTRCPAYMPPATERDAEHPLALIAPASHWFLNTIFANKPDLMKRAGEPRITLHPDDAARPRAHQRRARARVQRPRLVPGRGRGRRPRPPGRRRLDQGPLAQARARRREHQRHRRGARRGHGRRRDLP